VLFFGWGFSGGPAGFFFFFFFSDQMRKQHLLTKINNSNTLNKYF